MNDELVCDFGGDETECEDEEDGVALVQLGRPAGDDAARPQHEGDGQHGRDHAGPLKRQR